MIQNLIRRVLPAVAVVGFLSCDSGLFTIELEERAQTTVPGGTLLEELLGDLGFEDFVTVDITASEELENQGVQPGDIVDVTLTAFELEALSPSGADLTFLEEIAVYVEADGLSRQRIAWLDDFPAGAALVSFNLDAVDLTPYAVSAAMTIDTEVTGRSPDEDTTIEARFVLDVGVTSQGACSQVRGSADSGG